MRAVSVEDADMARMAREEGLEVMRPELGTQAAGLLPQPVALFEMLHRRQHRGARQNGIVDCVEGASVRLLKDGRLVGETTSDNYGDFKFDKLDEDSGKYVVEISANGRAKTVEAQLGASVNLGEIRL